MYILFIYVKCIFILCLYNEYCIYTCRVNERTLSVEMWAIDEEDRNAGENLNKVFLAQDIRSHL